MKSIKFVLAVAALILITDIVANAQKLPAIQQVSVRAPGNIKIDGKTTEWNDIFYAKNNNDRILYTISNDDDKLYLTVQALGKFGNEKIVEGGVTLTISHSVEKKREKDTSNISITFPLATLANSSGVSTISSNYFYFDSKERQARKKECDSLVNVINERADKTFKVIKIAGIKDVDTLISVYNATGIKAAVRFDQNMILVYELAIPLKYLGLTTDNPVKFSYDIKINHKPYFRRLGNYSPGLVSHAGSGGMTMEGMVPISENDVPPDIIYLSFATDFWGEYTLAKK